MEKQSKPLILEDGEETLTDEQYRKEEEDEVNADFKQEEEREKRSVGEEDVLRFLDSTDSYLTLMDSLNSTLRKGWLDLASARHSMGVSRVNSALLDLNFHAAATSVQLTQQEDSLEAPAQFSLRKWASDDNGKCNLEDTKSEEDKLHSLHLRHRGNSEEKRSPEAGAWHTIDDQVKKDRSKTLSVFGTLISPKLRAAQLSFETALETLVEIANKRSVMLSTFDQIHEQLQVTKR